MAENVFDKIAPGWYNFRHRTIFGFELAEMAKRWKGGRLLNIGCAHGPDFPPFAQGFELHGIDSSSEMLNLAVKYSKKFNFSANLARADAWRLPFAGDTFDFAISVAAYHHLRNNGDRKLALEELKRVLKPGGKAFITVWNRWQRRFWFSGKETAVPWKQKGATLYRYYYLFSYPEFEKLAKQAGFIILRSFPEHSYSLPVKFFSRNICLLVKKPE